MNGFRKLLVVVIICMLIITIAANLILINNNEGGEGRPYRVEAERIAYDMEQGKEIDLSKYKYITGISRFEAQPVSDKDILQPGSDKDILQPGSDKDLSSTGQYAEDYFGGDSDYLIKIIDGTWYRFDYKSTNENGIDKTIIILNVILGVIFIFVISLLMYMKIKILGPFAKMEKLPTELAKGNITAPIEAEKNKYFGNFIWGLNLLREKLEKGKQQDLESKKNNKSLILSLSHDIKTPLGIIELNSKALERGLYDNDKEKKDRIAGVINEKCSEIKSYVDQIIKASKDDVLELEVRNSEFYLSGVVNNIKTVYTDKLELLSTEFRISAFSDCMLKGDCDRAIEVIQNLMENAIKYGDKKEIELSFSREENSQLISVSNTGCTLEDTELPHIFDSFWRGSNTGSNSGSGLGLYICKQLMNRMNGDIFAEIKGGKMVVTAVFGMA